MKNFNKNFNFKIITWIISLSFIFVNMVYSFTHSEHTLRVPLISNQPKALKKGVPGKIEIINHGIILDPKVAMFDWDGTVSNDFYFWKEVEGEQVAGYTNKQYEEAIEWGILFQEKTNGLSLHKKYEMMIKELKTMGSKIIPSWDQYLRDREKVLISRYEIEKKRYGEKFTSIFSVKGVLDFIQFLKRYGIECYLTSGNLQKDLEDRVESMGMQGYFESIVGAPKTKVGELKKLKKAKQLTKNQLLMFGDGESDIKAAKEADCVAIGIAYDKESRDILVNAGADIIIWGDYTRIADRLFLSEPSLISERSTENVTELCL